MEPALKRILMVTTVKETLEAFLLPFAEALRERGWEVDAAASGASSSEGCRRAFDRVYDLSWSRNPLALGRAWQAGVMLREIVREREPLIVHVHTPIAAFVTRLALRDLRRPAGVRVVYTAHGFHFHAGGRPWKNALFVALEKLASRWTDYLIVINQEDEEAAKRYRLAPAERLRYVPGIGVDTERYNPARISAQEIARARAEMGKADGVPVFLMVAGFDRGKRHRDALAALVILRRRYPNARLTFAGSGRLMEKTRRLAKEWGLDSAVQFLGLRWDIQPFMRASTAVILPSEREGLSRSIMEAMSLAVPVIGANARGIRDLIDPACGLVFPVGQPAALAEAMAWIIEHPTEAAAMGEVGRRKMQGVYELRNIISSYIALYEQILAEHGEYSSDIDRGDK